MNRRSRSKKNRQVQTLLENLISNEFVRLFGKPENLADIINLQINLKIDPSNNLDIIMKPSLIQQIRTQLRELDIWQDDYQPGRVYCYLHESNDCDHCRPGNPGKVMAGYQSNGVPEWDDFMDVLIDQDPATASEFYEDRNRLAVIYMRGRDIKQKLLSTFGKSSKTYSILGQLVCGFFSIRTSEINLQQQEMTTLTIQAVEHLAKDGRQLLDLNIIPGSDRDNILDYFSTGIYSSLRDSLINTSRQLKDIESKINSPQKDKRLQFRKELMPKIPQLLMDIQSEINKINRRSSRRTRHAEKRSRDNRPVFKAVEDALKASRESILEDNRNKTILVPGKKQRWHVFTRTGKLVTSLYLEKEQVVKRIKSKRWQVPGNDRLSAFLTSFRILHDATEPDIQETPAK